MVVVSNFSPREMAAERFTLVRRFPYNVAFNDINQDPCRKPPNALLPNRDFFLISSSYHKTETKILVIILSFSPI